MERKLDNPYPFFSKGDWLYMQSLIEVWLMKATTKVWSEDTIKAYKDLLEKVRMYADLS